MEKIKGDTLLKDCELFIEARKITYDIIEFLDIEDEDSCKSGIIGMSIALRSLLKVLEEKDKQCYKIFEKLSLELVQYGFKKMENMEQKKENIY